jgi:exonuclease VII large subunit
MAASPQRILALGYTLTTCNGKIVRSVSDVEPGSVLTTKTVDGEFTSIINEIK